MQSGNAGAGTTTMPRGSLSVWGALQEHGLLPPFACDTDCDPEIATADLLPTLIRIWEQATVGPDRSARKRGELALLARLRQARESGAQLTLGVAGAQSWFDAAVGDRLVWWPRGAPAGQRVAVVSSRLGRWSKLPPHWFPTLRRVLEQIDPARQVLVSARGTALAELIARWAAVRQVPLLMFDVTEGCQSVRRWWLSGLRTTAEESARMPWQFPALVSPQLVQAHIPSAPVRDAVLMAASDQVVVCQARPRGNVWRLLEQRLAHAASSIESHTTILNGSGFTSNIACDALRRRGALVQPACTVEATGSLLPQGPGECETPCGDAADLIITPPDYAYLVHCTRAIDGPWPDQDRDDYLDELLFGGSVTLRTPLTTLMRIVAKQVLLATGRAIRGRFPVVCFTGVSLSELPVLRTFRPHRGRWDFEPYGIAIRRDWLLARGTRAVVYGDDSVWENMDETKRPFFQRRFSGASQGIDWSIEQEWRHVGGLDLLDLPTDAAFVFVPTPAAATALCTFSRWPVLVLPPL